MAKILTMAFLRLGESTTVPQDISQRDALTFEGLRKIRGDVLCRALKSDQKMRFGELRQRYGVPRPRSPA
jgi:GntR family transcriptional regulator, carbon starvation induced regulator